MRRVVSLYLPTWPTDRIRRRFGAPPCDKPLVTVNTAGSRRIVASACLAAQGLGLIAGMAVAQAQALIPDLHIMEADPIGDEGSLREFAKWLIRFSPVVAPDPPDGIWIDIAGVEHLFGGEEALLTKLLDRAQSSGINARAAIADGPGAAWAIARYGKAAIVPPGRTVDAISPLPVQALRLSHETINVMHRLGIERVGQLAAMPRAPMVRRFGREAALRLDQAMGHAFEPINPLIPKEAAIATCAFAEPIGRPEDLKSVVRQLSDELCRELAKRGEGVRRLDLIVRRVDQKGASLRVGTAKATRDHLHLARLFDERLETIDPGFGIEEVVLIAHRTEPLIAQQTVARGIETENEAVDLSRLVDRITTRVGADRVYRLAPVESRVPERMTTKVPALAPPSGSVWPEALPRPTRLLDPPEPIISTALLPDHPPAFFIWRRVRHKVLKADGPERITSEWWLGGQPKMIRDYYRLETDKGARFWIFRDAPMSEGGRWWMHGFFA
ncbi:Y-family DNA polymerase [Microvirga sp. Mcv34]|uniref:Y-family DNA polymerase n=1 Tax=Microvirga sp. Mcv34 TaxID=2926016 RepID=UPI0021C7ECAC|nr:DNA polymerase Y family protein [Microvirga sp. Mcv34]